MSSFKKKVDTNSDQVTNTLLNSHPHQNFTVTEGNFPMIHFTFIMCSFQENSYHIILGNKKKDLLF
jgi:hypothetical protein